jgi:hypothetical protein
LSIEAGESFENNNLTLKTYGTGNVVMNLSGTGELQLQATDPTIIFDTATATDTDYWLGVVEDAGGDDDDIFAIGDGTTPGTNAFLSIDTSGNVGIGTSAPGYKVDIYDTSATASTRALNISQTGAITGTGYGAYISKTGASTTNVGLYVTASGATNNYAAIFAAGNVGIGTTAPATLFDINGKFNVLSGGNVGIGTTAPVALLDVNGTTTLRGNLSTVDGKLSAFGDQASMVVNAGFEVDNNADSSPDGWTMTQTGTGTMSSSSTRVQGEYSLTLSSTSASNTMSLYSSCIPITEGITYNDYAMAQDNNNTVSVTNYFTWYTSLANCTAHSGGTNITINATADLTNSWQQIGGTTGAIPSTARWGHAYVTAVLDNGEAIYIDSVRIVPNALNSAVDLAENYFTKQDLIPGELVQTSLGLISGVERSNIESASTLLGVVSTNPAILLGEGIQTDEKLVEIALAGRVPVIVSNENGQIKSGDPITISTIPGVGAKASDSGYIIGTALESADNWSQSSCTFVENISEINWPQDDGTNSTKPCFRLVNGRIIGKLMMFVNRTFWQPNTLVISGDDALVSGNLIVNGALRVDGVDMLLSVKELQAKVASIAALISSDKEQIDETAVIKALSQEVLPQEEKASVISLTSSGERLEQTLPFEGSLNIGHAVNISTSSSVLQVEKTSHEYDRDILGVARELEGNSAKIVTYGIADLKVSTRNGIIQKGDFLTSSSDEGIAMKATGAGMVIGRALEDFSGEEESKNEGVSDNLDSNLSSESASIDENYEVLTREEKIELIKDNLAKAVEKENSTKFGEISVFVSPQMALPVPSCDITDADCRSQYFAYSYNNQDPNVLGESISGFDGTLSDAFIRDLVVSGIFITREISLTDNIGRGKILAGSKEALVSIPTLDKNSVIQITFEGDFAPATHYFIADKIPGESFKVILNTPTEEDVNFTWWIIHNLKNDDSIDESLVKPTISISIEDSESTASANIAPSSAGISLENGDNASTSASLNSLLNDLIDESVQTEEYLQ